MSKLGPGSTVTASGVLFMEHEMSDEQVRYRLIQDGQVVAWVEAEPVRALKEIRHYALIYSQDGPCHIELHRKGRWLTLKEPRP